MNSAFPFNSGKRVFLIARRRLPWVVETQLGRRNLNDEQHAYYMGKDYLKDRCRPGNPQFRQNDGIGKTSGKTAKRIADREGVSPSTVERNAAFAAAVDAHEAATPGAKEHILSGKSKLKKQEVIDTAPKLCERCKRVGAAPAKAPCPACLELRSETDTGPRTRVRDTSTSQTTALAANGAKLITKLSKVVEQLAKSDKADAFKRCARAARVDIRIEREQADVLVESYTETFVCPDLQRLADLFVRFDKEELG